MRILIRNLIAGLALAAALPIAAQTAKPVSKQAAETPEQLIEKIATEPNEEYYWNVVNAVDTNDQFFLDVAKEIARAYPWYIVRYSMRNLWHALFDPGYATTRYNTLGFIKTGGEFPPGTQGWGVRSEDPVTQYGSRCSSMATAWYA